MSFNYKPSVYRPYISVTYIYMYTVSVYARLDSSGEGFLLTRIPTEINDLAF